MASNPRGAEERASDRLLRCTPSEVRSMALALARDTGAEDASGPWAGDTTGTATRGSAAAARYVRFRVAARPPRGGCVVVCGRWRALGAWSEGRAIELLPEQGRPGVWASLCVEAPSSADAWPLEYFYVLRPASASAWDPDPSLWEAPHGAAPRRLCSPPPQGHVLLVEDAFGEEPVDGTGSSIAALQSYLDDELSRQPPKPGGPERPYQFCTSDILLTVLIYWPSEASEAPEAMPENVTASTRPARTPLLLYLHGYFSREPSRCLMPGVPPKALRQSPQLAGNKVLCHKFCVCTPIAPPEYYWMRKEPKSMDDGQLDGKWCFEHEYFPEMADALHSLVKWLQKRLAVDPARICLTGNSMGGYGAWELARLHPELFAALAITCGHYEPCPPERLARLICTLVDARLPIWVFHAPDDDVCSFDEARELVQLLLRQPAEPGVDSAETRGHVEVRLTTEGAKGHDAWSAGYGPDSELFDWLLSKMRRGEQPSGNPDGEEAEESAVLEMPSRSSDRLRQSCMRCCRGWGVKRLSKVTPVSS